MKSLSGTHMIEPTVFEEQYYFDSSNKIEGTWQWGIKILYMLETGSLEYLYIEKMINYEEIPIFGDYIQDVYTRRLASKKSGDKVTD